MLTSETSIKELTFIVKISNNNIISGPNFSFRYQLSNVGISVDFHEFFCDVPKLQENFLRGQIRDLFWRREFRLATDAIGSLQAKFARGDFFIYSSLWMFLKGHWQYALYVGLEILTIKVNSLIEVSDVNTKEWNYLKSSFLQS